MDTPLNATQIIILTTIINTIISGLVGGIVIYVIQKKIDAAIQQSLFIYQTKFTRLHEKRLETLEAWHQKYTNLRGALEKWIFELERAIKDGSHPDFTEREKVMREEIKAFNNFHDANELFLPIEINEKTGDIVKKVLFVYMAVKGVSQSDIGSPLDAKWVDVMKLELGLTSESDLTDPGRFLQALLKVLLTQSVTLYRLYKSVAEIDFDEEYRKYMERITPPKTEREWRKREKEMRKRMKEVV